MISFIHFINIIRNRLVTGLMKTVLEKSLIYCYMSYNRTEKQTKTNRYEKRKHQNYEERTFSMDFIF